MSGAGLWYAAAASGPKEPKQIILTSGTSWTVPSDWNNANNKVECIGAGASGDIYGGGGGAYARKNNLALTPGASVAYQVGVSSSGSASSWFGSTSTVFAAAAQGDVGGSAGACIGDVTYSGGSAPHSSGGYGGGGAAGPNGAGVSSTTANNVGGAGDAGFGGAGGASSSVAGTPGDSGGSGTEWGIVGSGGGGGGGKASASGNAGGGGGLYGGGGGASVKNQTSAGAPGVIVVTYTPA